MDASTNSLYGPLFRIFVAPDTATRPTEGRNLGKSLSRQNMRSMRFRSRWASRSKGIGVRRLAVRDDSYGAPPGEQLAQSVGVMGLIGHQVCDLAGLGKQAGSHRAGVEVARR